MPGVHVLRRLRRFIVSALVAVGLVVPFLAVGGWTALTASATSGSVHSTSLL